ncbi:MAG: hypothetical protein JNK14_17955 [Chitinophagaceae bacterium]|nr:hypothetical protein [Chitinophagaceae bacterium]
MQSENFDDKLRQAAEQHHPSYDEKAWTKMEKLLDRELPQKEDRRRRFLFFLLLILLLGGGMTWLILEKPWRPGELITTTKGETDHKEKPGQQDSSQEKTGSKPASQEIATGDNKETGKPGTQGTAGDHNNTRTENDESKKEQGLHKAATITVVAPEKKGISKTNGIRKVKAPAKKEDSDFEAEVFQGGIAGKVKAGNNTSQKDDGANRNEILIGKADVTDKKNDVVTKTADDKRDRNVAETDGTKKDGQNDKKTDAAINQPQSPKDSAGQPSEPVVKEEEAAIVKKNKKRNSFSFSLSAGPDISAIGWDNPGKIRMVSGAGIGYTIKERWTIRTGFYSASKIYDAKPADYKPAAPVPNQYLENIAADCKVYEIPLTLSYRFRKSSKGSPFASAGLSSFIMKKEKYDYYYYYPGNPQPYIYTHKEENKYKHYFSVLSLSAGYQRRINQTFSLAIEPYLKLPLAGVGYGNVKLKSAGVLISIGITPFGQGGGK